MGKKFLFLQKAIELFPDAIFVIDNCGILKAVNSQACKIFGYQEQELLDQHSEIILPENFRKKHRFLLNEYFKDPQTYPHLSPYRKGLTKGRGTIDVDMAIGPYSSDEGQLAVIVMHDITNKIQVERRLLESYKHLKAINNELEKFAHIISHDLKAPLNRISSLSKLLIHEIDEQKRHDIGSITDHLDNSINSVKDLIYGILEYSKHEDKAADEEYGEVDLFQLFHEIKHLLNIPENFQIELSPNLPKLRGNKTKLLQIFLNLISNSVKYNDKKQGLLRVEAGNHQGDFYEISFADNGPGVPQELQDDLFHSENRYPRELKEGSHGLGLTIVKKIVEQKGGKVWYEESAEQGANFKFTWPK